MRWAVFLIAALAGLVWETGLGEILRVEKLWDVRPSVCAVIAVFIALSAPRLAALWGCAVLGLLLDLSNRLTSGPGQVSFLIGPFTLGYAAGAWFVIQTRTMVFRRRALTVGVMTVAYLAIAQLTAMAILALRGAGWYPGGALHWTDYSPGAELVRSVLIAIYSGLLAVPVGWLLVRTSPAWGFATSSHRTTGIR